MLKTSGVEELGVINENHRNLWQKLLDFFSGNKVEPLYSIPILVVLSRHNISLGTIVKIDNLHFRVSGVEHLAWDWYWRLELEGLGNTPFKPNKRKFSYVPIDIIERPGKEESVTGLLNNKDGEIETRDSRKENSQNNHNREV